MLVNKTILVLMGGTSSEREVSLRSGQRVYKALLANNFNAKQLTFDGNIELLFNTKFDILFNIIHGGEGEDGKLSAMMELWGKPYIGTESYYQVITYAKHLCQPLIKHLGLNIPNQIIINNKSYENKLKNFLEKNKKIVIKPSLEGSSVGILITSEWNHANKHVKNLIAKYPYIVIEQYIDGVELTVGMIGYKDSLRIFTPLEINAKREFYNYEAKYTQGATEFIIPPRISRKELYMVMQEAKFLFEGLNIRDFARADCILSNGICYWHDVNTIPGMTELSDLPQEAEYDGLSYNNLVKEIILRASNRW